MKHSLIVLLLLVCALLGAIDDKYLYQLAHIKNITAFNIDSSEDQVLPRNQNYLWIYSIFNPWSPKLEAVFLSAAQIEDVNVMGGNYLYFCSQEPSNTVVPVDTLDTWTRISAAAACARSEAPFPKNGGCGTSSPNIPICMP